MASRDVWISPCVLSNVLLKNLGALHSRCVAGLHARSGIARTSQGCQGEVRIRLTDGAWSQDQLPLRFRQSLQRLSRPSAPGRTRQALQVPRLHGAKFRDLGPHRSLGHEAHFRWSSVASGGFGTVRRVAFAQASTAARFNTRPLLRVTSRSGNAPREAARADGHWASRGLCADFSAALASDLRFPESQVLKRNSTTSPSRMT